MMAWFVFSWLCFGAIIQATMIVTDNKETDKATSVRFVRFLFLAGEIGCAAWIWFNPAIWS
jgi:hypothetical protein